MSTIREFVFPFRIEGNVTIKARTKEIALLMVDSMSAEQLVQKAPYTSKTYYQPTPLQAATAVDISEEGENP
jgi:hypothetical protein